MNVVSEPTITPPTIASEGPSARVVAGAVIRAAMSVVCVVVGDVGESSR
jgi:hypothetical protein